MLKTMLLVIALCFMIISIIGSIWNLVMVLPFEIPVLSPVCFYINGMIRTKYYNYL